MKASKLDEKKVKALKKVVDPAKAAVASQENGGGAAIGIGISFAFVVPK